MYNSIKRSINLIFSIPSIIVFTIIFIFKALSLVRRGADIFDLKVLLEAETHLRIDYENYQGHINWIFWIIILLMITL